MSIAPQEPQGIARSAVLRISGEEAWRSSVRVLRKRLVRLPKVEPAPDQVSSGRELQKVLTAAAKGQKERGDAYLGVDTLLQAVVSVTRCSINNMS